MDRRKKIIIIALAVFAIALLVFILWLVFGARNINHRPTQQGSNPKIVTAGKATAILPVSSPARLAEEKKYPLGLKQLAMSFAERYGSYSTDLRTKNIDDLKPLMTDRLWQTFEDNMKEESSSTVGVVTFQGITTKGLSANLVSSDASSAVIMVSTQRIISTGNQTDSTVAYRKIKLSFIKSGNVWKVDDAIWQ